MIIIFIQFHRWLWCSRQNGEFLICTPGIYDNLNIIKCIKFDHLSRQIKGKDRSFNLCCLPVRSKNRHLMWNVWNGNFGDLILRYRELSTEILKIFIDYLNKLKFLTNSVSSKFRLLITHNQLIISYTYKVFVYLIKILKNYDLIKLIMSRCTLRVPMKHRKRETSPLIYSTHTESSIHC